MRHRNIARLSVALVAAAIGVGLATPAHATGPEIDVTVSPAPDAGNAQAILGLETNAYIIGTTLTVTATGTFDGGIIANNAVALQIAGTETYTDSSGWPVTVPLAGAPAAVRFVNRNTVQWQWALNSYGSTVHVDWTAEAAGLAPTPFFGSCAGTFNLLGMTEAMVKTC